MNLNIPHRPDITDIYAKEKKHITQSVEKTARYKNKIKNKNIYTSYKM